MSDNEIRDQLVTLLAERQRCCPSRGRAEADADAILTRWALVSRPDAENPTPALIEAAYIAQDDLSKPPEPWAIRAAAEVIDSYIAAQGHAEVHVLGHPKAVSTDA